MQKRAPAGFGTVKNHPYAHYPRMPTDKAIL
jgi:hypothetical protein